MSLNRLIKTPFLGAKFLKFNPRFIQKANITSRTTRGCPLRFYPPFPYKEKKFKRRHAILDNTMLRVNSENSKIIVVEGPIGVGKSAFCQALAEELEMAYFPQPTMDEIYVFPSGYDVREIDHLIPEEARTYDHKNFCIEPKTWKAFWFQKDMLYLRFFQYFDALCHMFNTGQGIILERSFYSDFVFLEAMLQSKYISPSFKKPYYTLVANTKPCLLHPHVVIYLDIPVPIVQERIRTRNYSWEQNSPALTKQYLQHLEKFWKQNYLRYANQKSEVLIYDWSDGGDIDVVIDDIEKLDLDVMRRDRRFIDWWLSRDDLFLARCKYTNQRADQDYNFQYPWYEVDEVKVTQNHLRAVDEVLVKNPETRFDKGYNYLMGDKVLNILFKTNVEDHRHPKFHLVVAEDWGY